MIKIWLREIRASFLVLSVVLVMIGAAAARNDGFFSLSLFLATVFGVVAAHISVNLFNEYSDWRTGVDAETVRTPFSGGSGNLQAGLLEPSQVYRAAWIALVLAFITGVVLAWISGWQILILMVFGGIVTVFYTDYLARWMVGEIASGLTLGSFVVIGAYFVQTGVITAGIVCASIPPGLLTMELLFLNEFPDVDADRHGGRKHMVIVLGKKRAAVLYTALLIVVYSVLAFCAATGRTPKSLLLCLITLPFAVSAAYHAMRYHDNPGKFIFALGMNVVVVLATDFLMALGFVFG